MMKAGLIGRSARGQMIEELYLNNAIRVRSYQPREETKAVIITAQYHCTMCWPIKESCCAKGPDASVNENVLLTRL
jgi:hypothetical protein